MILLLINILANPLISGLLMKHNLDWHRKLVAIFAPIFFIFLLLQSEYIIARIKSTKL
ncbi:hypothetical protein [Niallia sp. NCCP-28]|uniref:hypothetical protein n=1 Tax=Niallia sp. NCCP-28 TaxID=2934712 RepID=UPI00207E340C|nr:hypothetical protein [Niallia sp. NCCP-28]GKU82617.1 hypothetical protein NCCP28_20130 [Niallia sp. NCCP-28]